MSSITFPYTTFAAGVADHWSRIGGQEEAFNTLVKGYKQGIWRKTANEKHQDEVKVAMAHYKKYMKEHGTKAERELGRIPKAV
jgi:hypothetical protein